MTDRACNVERYRPMAIDLGYRTDILVQCSDPAAEKRTETGRYGLISCSLAYVCSFNKQQNRTITLFCIIHLIVICLHVRCQRFIKQ